MFARLFHYLSIIPLICFCLFFSMPMIAHADGGAPNRAYISGAAGGIAILDIAQRKVIGSLPVAGDLHMILLSLDGSYLYVTQPQLKQVAIISASTGQTFCTTSMPGHPTLLALDVNANILFAAANDTTSVTAIDPSNCQVKKVFQLHQPIYGLAVAAVGTSLDPSSGNQLWVADAKHLTVFDDVKKKQIKQVDLPDAPRNISIPPGSSVYVTTQQGNIFSVDLNSYQIHQLLSGGMYRAMDFDENTGQIYVPDQKNQQLVVLEPVNAGFALPQEPRRTIPLAASPEAVAVTSDGQLALVALATGQVAMLDVPSHQITNTFTVNGHPQFIITGLNPPVLSTTPQQASTLQNVLTVAAYVIVTILLIVPIILFICHNKKHRDQL